MTNEEKKKDKELRKALKPMAILCNAIQIKDAFKLLDNIPYDNLMELETELFNTKPMEEESKEYWKYVRKRLKEKETLLVFTALAMAVLAVYLDEREEREDR